MADLVIAHHIAQRFDNTAFWSQSGVFLFFLVQLHIFARSTHTASKQRVASQVRYGWTPTAALGPQMARLSERAKAATLRDCADRIDYEAAFGSEAWHHPDSPAKVMLPCFILRNRHFACPPHYLRWHVKWAVIQRPDAVTPLQTQGGLWPFARHENG